MDSLQKLIRCRQHNSVAKAKIDSLQTKQFGNKNLFSPDNIILLRKWIHYRKHNSAGKVDTLYTIQFDSEK
jgi:hypothetical protein